jgi:pyruvate/2-oxoglutarate dehydrogenase complex dihydrolipoamide acyltransferase (E2) component
MMTNVNELGLDGRIESALIGAGVVTVEDLVAKLDEGDEAVLAIDGIGAKSLEEIKATLAVDESEDPAPEAEEAPEAEPEPTEEITEMDRARPVTVRVLCEMGLLAGEAVWRNERHVVSYADYEKAKRANPDGYRLVLEE